MKYIEVLLTYKDNFPEEYVLSNEEAVHLIDQIKKDSNKFTIKGDTYSAEEISVVSFSDVMYEGTFQSIVIQF